jgi:2',3'-cyclic-nucleotide 2'-phosphodiesterase
VRPPLDNLHLTSDLGQGSRQFRVAYFGDIVGKCGKAGLRRLLSKFKSDNNIQLVCVNGENIAGGIGIDSENAADLRSIGVDLISLGDHAFHKKGYVELFNKFDFLIRPANFPSGAPGRGMAQINLPTGEKVIAINLLGRVFMGMTLDCPFRTMEELLKNAAVNNADIVLVDFHAETTSEKISFAKYFDGLVSLIVGTHTHVQTNDAQILPKGTAYITDLGMCGSDIGVIGMDFDVAITRMRQGLPSQYKPASSGDCLLSWLEVTFDLKQRSVSSVLAKRLSIKI